MAIVDVMRGLESRLLMEPIEMPEPDYSRKRPANDPVVSGPVLDASAQIKTFGDLPTKEIDDVLAAAKAEVAALEAEAQEVRDLYVAHTNRIVKDINRLRQGVAFSIETMKNLRDQCAKLDAPTEKDAP